jgi:hypothetical protein
VNDAQRSAGFERSDHLDRFDAERARELTCGIPADNGHAADSADAQHFMENLSQYCSERSAGRLTGIVLGCNEARVTGAPASVNDHGLIASEERNDLLRDGTMLFDRFVSVR